MKRGEVSRLLTRLCGCGSGKVIQISSTSSLSKQCSINPIGTRRKAWSMKFNSLAQYHLNKNDKKKAKQLYLLAIKLYPFWRGNYIDIIKSILWHK